MRGSKTRSRLAWIRLLMGCSMVLLVAFMAYWLRSQYNDGKARLKKDLLFKLEASQQVISDSVIMVNIVNPALKGLPKDKVTFRGSMWTEDTIRVAVPDLHRGEKRKRIAISTDSIIRKNVFYYENTSADMSDALDAVLSRGVRMMIKSTKDLPVDVEKRLLNIDTALLALSFRRSLSRSDMPFSSKWIPSGQHLPHDALYLSTLNTPEYNLSIQGYNGYILTGMMPQFIITLFLLSITAIAFIVTYRGLSSQMRLAVIRNDLISNMSHELKTPVSTVKVALEAIAEPEVLQDLPKAKEYIHMAALEMNRLEMLINQSLQSSLLEEGNISMQPEPVDMKVLVEDIAKVMQPRFEHHNASLSFATAGDSFIVPVDKLQIQGVVINILDNALKYAGNAPDIKVLIDGNTDGVRVSIEDNGPGIPDAYASRIFDKFFRVPRGNEHSVKGYGLGLSYAAQVMKLHNGSITMRPAPGGGCIFFLQFRKDIA